MTATTSASPVTAPHAMIAIPEHHSAHRRTGPLRSGNPRGDPNLAPRCGAKARTTGCSCCAPAMPNGRCRLHGGKSTGPRTPEGRASLARAHTTHGEYAEAGPGAVRRAANRYTRMLLRRSRLKIAAFNLLRGLPPALAARLLADEVTELHAPVHYAWFQDAPVPGGPGSSAPGQAPCKAGRDARGRFAAAPPPVLRGRKAELARAHAEAAALAPWKAAIARARLIKRVMKSQDRAVRRAKLGRGPMHGLPAGTCPGGGTVRPDGAAGEGSDTNSMNSGAGGAAAEAACEDSNTNSMNSGAGGGTAGARADAPAAAQAPKGGAAGEDS